MTDEQLSGFDNMIQQIKENNLINKVETYLASSEVRDYIESMGVDVDKPELWRGTITGLSVVLNLLNDTVGLDEATYALLGSVAIAFIQNYEDTNNACQGK